jgi:hypothetical protein
LVNPITHRFEGILLATSSVVVVIVRNGPPRPPDLSRLGSPDGGHHRPLKKLPMRFRLMTPTAILPSVTGLSIRMAPAKSIAQQKSGAAAPLLEQNAEKLCA